MNNQPTQEFRIEKNYIGYQSRNRIEFSGSEEDCKFELQQLIHRLKRLGADIESEDEYQVTCENHGKDGESVQYIITAL